MPIKLRKFIGLLIFIIVLCAYVLAAVQIVDIMKPDSNIFLQMLVYAALGIGWVIPAGIVIKWMSKP